jgi:hypothetical protein
LTHCTISGGELDSQVVLILKNLSRAIEMVVKMEQQRQMLLRG